MLISKYEYDKMFTKFKELNIWSYDYEIHEMMKFIEIEIRTYSEDEIVEGVKEGLRQWNDETLN